MHLLEIGPLRPNYKLVRCFNCKVTCQVRFLRHHYKLYCYLQSDLYDLIATKVHCAVLSSQVGLYVQHCKCESIHLLTWWSAPPSRFATCLNHLPWIWVSVAFVAGVDSSIFWRNGKHTYNWYQSLGSRVRIPGVLLDSISAEPSVDAEGEIADLVVSTSFRVHDMA